jgi:hypothetical protein
VRGLLGVDTAGDVTIRGGDEPRVSARTVNGDIEVRRR